MLPRARVTFIAVGVFMIHCWVASALRNGLDLVPPLGWSNWENSGCNINETYMKANADALKAKGLQQLGYTIVEVDDCWAEKDRNSSGFLVPNASRFPSGMAGLGEYLHQNGFKFGMYSSAGAKCCQGTMPGSLGYEWLDAQVFAEWGVDFLKYDGCFMEEFATVEQDAKRRFPFTPPPILRYPIMSQALNRTGRKISYMCNFPWSFWGLDKDQADGGQWVAEVCNSWRVAGDPQPGFSNAMSYADSIAKYADIVTSGPGAWATLDAIEIGNNMSFDVLRETDSGTGLRQAYRLGGGGMSASEERAAISIYMLAKTPIFIGADVTTLSGHSLDAYMNKDLIDVHQDPLGAPGRQIRNDGSTQIWACALSGGRVAAALLNRGSTPITMNVTWAELDGLPQTTLSTKECKGAHLGAGARSVYDVWAHKSVGHFADGYSATIPPSDVVVITVSKL